MPIRLTLPYMVPPEGFEPPTPMFVALYSGPLSYGGIELVPLLRFERRKLLLLRETTLPICPQGHMVPTSRIERLSTVLQTAAMTTSAKLAKTGATNENRTHDSGITTRGFSTKL